MKNDKGQTEAILTFWFEELRPQDWFVKNTTTDELIIKHFQAVYEELARQVDNEATPGKPETAHDYLAWVIVLDQFPRNMFRDDPKSFAADAGALALARQAIDQGLDQQLSNTQRTFLYMPFQHSEDATVQAQSIELFALLNDPDTLDYAMRHKEIIDRFGRFPHRNKVLGRPSTPAEITFLEQPGSSF